MTAESAISKMSPGDFLAVVTPGFFMLSVSVVVWLPDLLSSTESAEWTKHVGELWAPTILVVILGSYVLGNVPRAFSVDKTDTLCQVLFRFKSKDPEKFPYRKELRKVRDAIIGCDLIPATEKNFPLVMIPGKKTEKPVSVFDFWKNTLLMEQPGFAPVVNYFEMRSRFFVGMFWASVYAFFYSGFICLWRICCGDSDAWKVALAVCAISVAFSGVFGYYLQRVRLAEAIRVYLAMLRYTYQSSQATAD